MVKYHLYCGSSKIAYQLHSKYYILLLHDIKCGDLLAYYYSYDRRTGR